MRSCSLHHLAAPVPVARPCTAWPAWLCTPHPWEGWEADLQPARVQGAGNSPHLGLHHADPLFSQLLYAVKHIHLPLSFPHLQEEVQGDEGTCAPNPCAEDAENWGQCCHGQPCPSTQVLSALYLQCTSTGPAGASKALLFTTSTKHRSWAGFLGTPWSGHSR